MILTVLPTNLFRRNSRASNWYPTSLMSRDLLLPPGAVLPTPLYSMTSIHTLLFTARMTLPWSLLDASKLEFTFDTSFRLDQDCITSKDTDDLSIEFRVIGLFLGNKISPHAQFLFFGNSARYIPTIVRCQVIQ